MSLASSVSESTDDDRASGVSWSYVRSLEERLDALERWRAAQDAVSVWRRWAVPIAGTALLGVANLVLTLSRLQ